MQFRKKNLKIKSQKGGNLLEYSLMLALITIIAKSGLQLLGFSISDKYVASAMELGQCGEQPKQLVTICIVGGKCFDQYVVPLCAIEEEVLEKPAK